jgi:hypothetical protein
MAIFIATSEDHLGMSLTDQIQFYTRPLIGSLYEHVTLGHGCRDPCEDGHATSESHEHLTGEET